MLKHTILVAAVAGLVLALSPAAQAAISEVIPPAGGYPVTGYRLAFVTSGKTNATSTVIGDYNTFVNDQAGIAGSIVASLDVDWYFIGSTKGGIDAKHNTNTLLAADPGYVLSSNVPIYRLDGQLLAATNADLWDGALDARITVNQLGAEGVVVATFTGTSSDGSERVGYALGDTSVGRGTTGTTDTWLGTNTSTATYTKWAYALSAPIPEPATMALLGLGGLGLILGRKRR